MALKFLPALILILFLLAFLAPALALFNEGMSSFRSLSSTMSEDIFLTYGQTSLLLVVGSVCGALLFGLSAAYLCARFDFLMRRQLLWLSLLPLAVPSYLVTYTWVDVLVDQGVRGGALRTLPATCIVFALCLSPYIFLPTYAALTSMSRSVIESAQLLGKNRWEIFFRIELPIIRSSLFAGSALVGMEVLADFGTVDFMAIDTWSTGIFRSWFGYGDREKASALALVLFSASGLVLFWQTSVSGQKSVADSVRISSQYPRQKAAFFKLLPMFLLTLLPPLLSCLFPAAILLNKALFDFSKNHWLEVFPAAFTSLWIAVLTSSVVVILGLLFVLILRSNTWSLFRVLARLGTLGYAFPGGVLGLGLLILLAPFSLTGSLIGLVYAYCIRFATIGSSTIEAAWRQIPNGYYEQARVLGCTKQSAFLRVTLPILRKSIACAFVLTCIDVVKELPATMLLRPFNFETLALRTYTLASDERLSETAPSSFLMIVLSLIGIFAAEKMGAFGVSKGSLPVKND